MKFRILLPLIKLGLFWILWFAFSRLVFLVITSLKFGEISSDSIKSFYYSLRLDCSMTAYILIPFILIFFIFELLKREIPFKLFNSLFLFMLSLAAVITVSEACLYTEWKTKLSIQALQHLSNPDEVIRTVEFGLLLTFIFFVFLLILSGSFASGYVLNRNEAIPKFSNRVLTIVEFLCCSGILIVMLRGGFQPIPISRSDALFSNNNFLNDAAINPIWNLANDAINYQTQGKVNPYIYMPMDEAKQIVEKTLRVEKDTTVIIFNSQKPNIVFIVLESWSAFESKALGGDNFTPVFDSLSKNGLLFTNCISAAHTSDQGIPAILSSHPSSPKLTLINQASKSNKIPSIAKSLREIGYSSGFVYGGDLNYGNIKNYLFAQGFDKVDDEKTIEDTPNKGRLGANDWEMAKIATQKMSEIEEPFVYCWFTISSHSPYDIPVPIEPLVNHPENKYVNSIRFSDIALKSFFKEAKLKSWYKNTIFILVADHSHSVQQDIEYYEKDYHRIPFFILGDILLPEWRGLQWKETVSQLDITTTILSQIGQSHTSYKWGRNIFNPYSKPSAFYVHNLGCGFVTNDGYYNFSPCCNWFGSWKAKDDSSKNNLAQKAKAFLQLGYEDYLKR